MVENMSLTKKKLMDFSHVTNLKKSSILRKNMKAVTQHQKDKYKLRPRNPKLVAWTEDED